MSVGGLRPHLVGALAAQFQSVGQHGIHRRDEEEADLHGVSEERG